MKSIALRIDVDTFRGARRGVPRLLRLLDAFGIRALFLFAVGPDNMGRNLPRLLRPSFLWKMLRSDAPGLYGWDILLRGTLGPGPRIVERNADVVRACAEAGHEIGIHSWDHCAWQNRIESMSPACIREQLRRACDVLSVTIGRKPDCTGAPGWRCTDAALLEGEAFGFRYACDCVGRTLFRPEVGGRVLRTPQLPRTMPTYDELVGRNGVTLENYNERLLRFARPDGPNVLTVHAEVEGGARFDLFEAFLRLARERGYTFLPPGDLLPAEQERLPVSPVRLRSYPGRDGSMATQENAQPDW